MAAITVERVVIAGLEPTFVAAAGGGDTFVNEGKRTFYAIDNASGGAITVTFDGQGVGPASAVAFDDDVDVSVGAGEVRWVGPFPISRFTSTVAVTYSGVTSLTVAAVQI